MKSLAFRLKYVPLILFVALLALSNTGNTQNALASPPPEFENLPLISGLNEPMSFRFLPDGDHFLVAEKAGIIRVFHIDLTEAPVPFLTLPVSTTGEQGLLAIEVDPDFALNGDVYVYYTTPAGFNRLSKFTSFDFGHTANPNSEVVLLESDVPSDTAHHGGDIHVGAAGEIWLTMGENLNPGNAQNLGNMHGKIMRVNKDGTIPADNPHLGDPTANDAIWAHGLRNPFRFTLLPNGKPLVADVGQNAWEELNIIEKGANYGWPLQEGPCTSCPYTNPAFAYPNTLGYASVTAAMVYSGSTFPPQYQGAVFYGDYAIGWIRYLVFDENYETVISDNDFEPYAGTVVDMQQGPDGSLYYATIFPGGLHKIAPSGGNRAPVVQASADPTAGLPPLSVDFSSAGTYDPDGDPLSYLWEFGDGATSTDPNPSHEYTSAPSASPPSDTVGHWTFDEPPGSTTAADSSGNGNHGTLVDMDAQTAWVAGKVGGAINLDGLDDYVSTGFVTQLPSWSVAAWVKSPAAPAATGEKAPIYRGQAFHFHWNHPDPVHRGASTVMVGGEWHAASFGDLQPDRWYHLASMYDGETMKTYKDGILVTANTTPSGPTEYESMPLLFGKHANDFFGGTIDDVRIYGRPLSTQEIASLAGGNMYSATLTVSDTQKSSIKTLGIAVGNEPPTATIDSPSEGSTYDAGDSISFGGSGSDPQDGILPASALSWKVIFHHLEHVHPYLGPIQGQADGSFLITTDEMNNADTWYEVQLTVTDLGGLKHTTSKNIYPNLVELTVNSSPAGSQFTVDGRPYNDVLNEQAVVGVERVLHAPSPQFIGGVRYKFDQWSDGGQQTHAIVTPGVDTTYTANFVEWPLPPPPWLTTDVGGGLPGSAEYNGGVFTLTGAGSDIWGELDDFRYVYQPLSGNGEIIARVTSQTPTDGWAKAGVMIKESATVGAPYALLAVTPSNGYAFQHTVETSVSGEPYAFPNAWMKLTRSGNAIEAYTSTDGVVWDVMGAGTVPMATDVTVGLFVNSHNPSALGTVTFDNVTVTDFPPPDPPPPPPWVTTDIGSPTIPGSAQYASGVFTLSGAGTDIWGELDEFHYVYQPVSGNGEIIARVTSQTPTDGWAKAGIMIKESATAGAPYALLAVTPANGYAFQHTVETNVSGQPYAFPNAWMKLTRSGNTIEAYTSPDGISWSAMGSATIPMTTAATVGLFVNSHWSPLSTVTFDNVSVTMAPDLDADGVSDAGDNCPAWPNPGQASLPWPVPVGDADCDGFTATIEAFVGTDAAKHCSNTSATNDESMDAWPTDFNDSRFTTLADVNMMSGSYNKLKVNSDGYNGRFDLNASDSVTLSDVALIAPFYNKSCT